MGKIPLQNNTHEHLKTLGLFSAVSTNMCNSLSSGNQKLSNLQQIEVRGGRAGLFKKVLTWIDFIDAWGLAWQLLICSFQVMHPYAEKY